MKIAHITTIDLSLRYLLLNQLLSLREAGYEVVGISAPGPDVPALEAAGLRHIPAPLTRSFSPLVDLVALAWLYRIMRRERFTIVHTHTPKPGLLGQVAARLAGAPVVVNTLHGFYFHDRTPPAWRHFYIAMEKIAARCSDVILSQNREDIRTAVAEGICPPERIKPLGNGIDLDRFDRAALDPARLEQLRRELGLPPGGPVVGFTGRLVREKGVLELLQAAQSIRPRLPGLRLLLVGPIDMDKPDALTPAIAAEYGLADACVFTGLRQDMPELYALMDLFVLPSHREGFPRAPMEASAMGVPCVVTDIRGCRETVEPGVNGRRVSLGDVPALAQAMLALLSDPVQSRRMGEAGCRLARERFDEQLVFARVKAEYARLLQEKGLPLPVPAASKPANVQTNAQTTDGRPPATTPDVSTFQRSNVQTFKRLLDLVLTVPALLLLAPLLALLALLVRLKLGAPVLFRQQRPGLGERPFTIYKFRTMTDQRDAHGQLLPDADRLAAFGRFLRSTSLDELPELFNVLKGDMSLVGPRPLLMQYLERYTPEQRRRHELRPGLTGWAQVNGRNALSWAEKFALDVWYVDHCSFWLDLKIISLTFWKIVRRQDINQPGQATMEEFKG